ncbi:hypothetical protein [Prescottella sp. R16]|uniref:hypothetical protein n=1 Tax=Prescottella sp. R16 TaxID=3064529 RepID=UPI00272E5E5A|nr:hypothetical protein [Prescottella sp. R16]
MSALVLAMVTATMAVWVRRLIRSPRTRADYLATVRALRWWMIPGALAQITLVVTAFWATTTLLPVTRFGWWTALGGSGNIAFGQSGRDGIGWTLVAVAVPVLLVVLIPVFAHNEERIFREGSETWSRGRRIRTPIVFGLVHLTMGIPVAAGVALAVSGFYFQWMYLRVVRPQVPAIDALYEASRQTVPAPPTEEPCPPLPVGAPYDPDEWDRVQALRAEVRARNWQRRQTWDGENLRRLREQRAALRAPAVATAAAAHTASNWLLCGTLAVLVVVDLVIG